MRGRAEWACAPQAAFALPGRSLAILEPSWPILAKGTPPPQESSPASWLPPPQGRACVHSSDSINFRYKCTSALQSNATKGQGLSKTRCYAKKADTLMVRCCSGLSQ